MNENCLLTDRDMRLFEFLYKFKVASINDVRELVFEHSGNCHVYKRLSELSRFGFIQKIPFQRKGKSLAIYSLKKKALKLFMFSIDNSNMRKQVFSDKIEHDLAIVQFYKRIIKSNKISGFISENVLVSGSAIINSFDLNAWIKQRPDGIVVSKGNGETFYLPLELELSIKNGFRYETKLLNYYKESKIPAIIYIGGSQSVIDSVCRIENRYCEMYQPKVFYGLLDQFKSKSDELVLINRGGDKFIL